MIPSLPSHLQAQIHDLLQQLLPIQDLSERGSIKEAFGNLLPRLDPLLDPLFYLRRLLPCPLRCRHYPELRVRMGHLASPIRILGVGQTVPGIDHAAEISELLLRLFTGRADVQTPARRHLDTRRYKVQFPVFCVAVAYPKNVVALSR